MDPLERKDWKVYLNTGHGFDLRAPLTVPRVAGALSNGGPASTPGGRLPLDVNYPGLKSGWSDDTFKYSEASVDAAFVDADGDGVADIAAASGIANTLLPG